jgi:hypothetical protein
MEPKRQSDAFHPPLQAADTPSSTLGCRHTNPEICAKNQMASVCAFARNDGMCLAPPVSWKRQYEKLERQGARER